MSICHSCEHEIGDCLNCQVQIESGNPLRLAFEMARVSNMVNGEHEALEKIKDEMPELHCAITDYKRKRGNARENLIEELSDVLFNLSRILLGENITLHDLVSVMFHKTETRFPKELEILKKGINNVQG